MCGLCAALGGPAHWSSAAGRLHLATSTTPRAERARSVALLDRIAGSRGATVSDWQGSAYLVASATGAQELVATLGLVWPALDRLAGRPIDPLADEWLLHG